MLDGFYKHTLNIEQNWAKQQWVYVYVFSDGTADIRGFGAFVRNVAP